MATSTNVNNSTSFHKKARVKVGQIQGTKPSLFNSQLLISTGIPSVDNVIGGGLAVGTVLLVEEDTYGSYARLMLKYFLAEALVTNQSVLVSSASEDVRQLMKELPNVIADSGGHVTTKSFSPFGSGSVSSSRTSKAATDSSFDSTNDVKMTIAFRYQNNPKVQVVPTSGHQFGHYYDLTTTMSSHVLDSADVSYATSTAGQGQGFSIMPAISSMNPNYCQLLRDIKNKVQTGGFGTAQETEKRTVLRIGVQSLGSPLWGEPASGEGFDCSLPLFLIALRGILRTSLACALVTVPSHLFCDGAFVGRLEHLADTVIRLESFTGSDKEKNPAFKEYHGLFHIIQLPRLNSLVPPLPEVTDLAFKLRRKKFTIEKLHLPPELADTTSKPHGDHSLLSKSTGSACSSGRTEDLSF